jgi:signal transduction histidine kinase
VFRCVVIGLLFTALAYPASSQNASTRNRILPDAYREAGFLYSRTYTQKEYDASPQSWEALSDKYGGLVFANGDGVLTYDGTSWTLIETPTQSVIRSLAIDNEGVVYVGALDDFGYLKPTPTGALRYESMLSLVEPELREMGNIWSLYTHRNLIYFEAETGVFVWNGEKMSFLPWPNPNSWHKSFLWNDTYYVSEHGSGLLVMKDGQFVMAPGGEVFREMRIYSTAPATSGSILLGTQVDGLYIYDGQQASPFESEANDFLTENLIYSMCYLPGNLTAIGTRRAGIVVIDSKGTIVRILNATNSLPSDIIHFLHLDQQQNLWVCSDNGLTRVELGNRLTTFFQGVNLECTPNDLLRHNGTLYMASSLGLYFLERAELPHHGARFEKFSGIDAPSWQLLSIDGVLLVASTEGLYQVNGRSVQLIDDHPSYALHRCKADSTRIFSGGESGLLSFRRVNGNWKESRGVDNLRLDNIRFNEAKAGKLWITTFSQGANLLDFTQADGTVNYDQLRGTTNYGTANGLPQGYLKVSSIGNEEYFRVGGGSAMYRFDEARQNFLPDTTFEKDFGLTGENAFPTTNADASGTFLCRTRVGPETQKGLFIIGKNKDGSIRKRRYDISRVFESASVVTYFEEPDIIWHAGGDGILQHELVEDQSTRQRPFTTLVRKITLDNDSVILQGIHQVPSALLFPYGSNVLRFEVTSTNYNGQEGNRFQYRMLGYDDVWSEWTTEKTKEYSRLWEGDYVFEVRSRNYAAVVSSIASVSVRVNPPWYRTLYAFAAYFMAAALLVWGMVRWRSYQLMQERTVLRKEVANRTREITKQNVQLAEQSEELRVNAEQLKELDQLKSAFFVNISHEFRTPLSLILGPLEKSIQVDKENAQLRSSDIQRMHRNAKRLQQLINQLLDLAKLESGSMKVAESTSDLMFFLRVLTASFESQAEIRNIDYRVVLPSDTYFACFDHDKLETILYNLLSNAFKFTPDGGDIAFKVSLERNGGDTLRVSVEDSGPGIPETEREKIFDRFYQIDSSASREFEGSGIGLSLVKELVQLLGGVIQVSGTPGGGAKFTIALTIREGEVTTQGEEVEISSGVSNHTKNADVVTTSESAGQVHDQEGLPIILVVEDNEDLQAYLRENLDQWQWDELRYGRHPKYRAPDRTRRDSQRVRAVARRNYCVFSSGLLRSLAPTLLTALALSSASP